MTDGMKLFWGDDEHEDENPQNFINGIERQFSLKTNITDAQKLRTFELNLEAGAVANQWWDGLASADKDTWEHLVRSFATKWPSKAPTVKTVEEKQAALERTTITEEEVGKRVKTKGVEEFAHVVWADKVERLAAAIPDTNGLLIGAVRKTMPKILQKVTGSGHTDWASFCKAVRTATLSQIDEAREEEREARHVREELKKLQDARNTTTRDLTNSFQRFAIGTPSPTPRFPILRNQTPQTQNHSPAPTFNTNNPFATQNQPPHRQNRPPAERMADIIRLALPIHPNTPAGRALYNTQIAQWNSDHPGQLVSELRPYPLSPGTAPIMSGECWKCGMIGHMSPNCDSLSPVPAFEGRWRSIAATIKRSCPPTATRNVNYVGTNPWITKEEYDQQVIADFLAEQGKGSGSSA
jgi:hypothetical protein